MTTFIVIAVIVAVLVHLAGGAHGHARARRRGLRPNLYYSLGRGWWGSIRIGGFRIGHRL